jgi:hypothetical protein
VKETTKWQEEREEIKRRRVDMYVCISIAPKDGNLGKETVVRDSDKSEKDSER